MGRPVEAKAPSKNISDSSWMTTGMHPCTTASSTRDDQPSPGKARQKVWPISSSWYLRECSLMVTPSSQREQLSGNSLRHPYTYGVQSRIFVFFGSQNIE